MSSLYLTCCSGDHDGHVHGAVDVLGRAVLDQPAGYQAQVDQDEDDVEGKVGGVVPIKNIYCLYVNNFFENTKGSIHQLKLL